MENTHLLLLQSEYQLLHELLQFLETFNQYTLSIQKNYASLSNSVIIMRDHLYEIVTNSVGDCKAIKEVKKMMHANWDTRIPSMGLHYIAAFLDPSLKNLRSLVDYTESREDAMSEFIISIITEMGITMKQLCLEEQPTSEKQPADPEVKEIDPPTPASSECEAPKENPSRLENPSMLKQKLGPKERQFEAKRQNIDLIKRLSMPAASKDAKSKLQAEVAI